MSLTVNLSLISGNNNWKEFITSSSLSSKFLIKSIEVNHKDSPLDSSGIFLVDLDVALNDSVSLVIYQLRKKFGWSPYIFCTSSEGSISLNQLTDQVKASIDDFLEDPYDLAAFKVKLLTVSRRKNQEIHAAEKNIKYSLSIKQRVVHVGDQPIKLSNKAFSLFLFFYTNMGVTFTRDQIYSNVWSTHRELHTRTLDTHVSKLKRLLKLDGTYGLKLHSVYGVGYMLEAFKGQPNHRGFKKFVQVKSSYSGQRSEDRKNSMVNLRMEKSVPKDPSLSLDKEWDRRALISQFAAEFMASSPEEFDETINKILRNSGKYMQADRTYIFLFSDDNLYLNNSHEWCAPGIIPQVETLQGIPADSVNWWLDQLRNPGHVLVPCVDEMPPEARVEQEILQAQDIKSVCVYPLMMGKELIGFLGNDAVRDPRHWGPDMLEFLELMSGLLSIAIAHRRLHHERVLATDLLERTEQLVSLGHWSMSLISGDVTWSSEVFKIFERDPNKLAPDYESYLRIVHKDDKGELELAFEKAKSMVGNFCIKHRIVLDNSNVKYLEVRGQVSAGPDGLARIVEGTVQDITEKMNHQESLRRLTFEDPLTGLPNARSAEDALLRELDFCQKNQCRLVLALIDLDNFSVTNEMYGTVMGDILLKTIAQRILLVTEKSDFVAHVGGDEFLVLLTPPASNEDDSLLIGKLLSAISQPITLDSSEFFLTASIGVAEFSHYSDATEEQLLGQARHALFQAKLEGKNRLHKYDAAQEQDFRELAKLLEAVHTALHLGQFVLHYQPKIQMATGLVVGVEALLRWKKPSGQLVPPGEFLPALQNHPLEIQLGDWVISTALAQIRTWSRQGLKIQLSVNVSSQQLLDEHFFDKLAQTLNDHPEVPPTALQFELLESSAVKDMTRVADLMQRCCSLGVSFALDDFGTGFSTLTYLKHLPVSAIKIDKSFVIDMLENNSDLPIISSIVSVGKAFGLEVIAEGVEKIEHAELLVMLGCNQGQGYAISRPLPAEDLLDWLESWQTEISWKCQAPFEADSVDGLQASTGRNSYMKV